MTSSTPTVLDLLERGRDRIRRGWTQHAPARTSKGITCGADSPDAVAWCVGGAAWSTDDTIPDFINDPCYAASRKACAELRKSLPIVSPGEHHIQLGPWNDTHRRSQADALELYNVTIARVRRENRADKNHAPVRDN